MGLPDEGLGVQKKRSRLCLNPKRKEIAKEASIADEHEKTSFKCMNKITTAANDPAMLEEGLPLQEEMTFSGAKAPLVAPVSSLYNLGNTCFFNCMLQVMRYTPGFLARLGELRRRICHAESRIISEESNDVKKEERAVWKLVTCLDNLYKQMKTKEEDYRDISPTDSAMMAIRPDALLDQIRVLNPLFEGNFQHDAQEFLRCLLSCLDDAEMEVERELMSRKPKKDLSGNEDVKKETTTASPQMESDGSSRKGQKRQTAAHDNKGKMRKAMKSEEKASNQSNSSDSTSILALLSKKKAKLPSFANTTEVVGRGMPKIEGMKESGDNDMASEITDDIDRHNNGDHTLNGVMITDEGERDIRGIGSKSVCEDNSKEFSWADNFTAKCRPSDDKRKRVRLGVRGVVVSHGRIDGPNGPQKETADERSESAISKQNVDERSNSINKQNVGERLSTCKGTTGEENEVVFISDDDEESVKKCDTTSTTTTGKQPNPSDRNLTDNNHRHCSDDVELQSADVPCSSIPPPWMKKDDVSGKEEMTEEDDRSSTEREVSRIPGKKDRADFVLSPGKKLAIHSPMNRQNVDHSAKLPMSNSFLSRIQGFFPSSAVKFLRFSSPGDSSQSTGDGCPSTSSVDEVIDLTNDNFQEDEEETDVRIPVELSQDSINQAKLHLKRCDWLGVSPVRPVSASFAMGKIENQSEFSSSSSSSSVVKKRKRDASSTSKNEEPEKGEKKCKLEDDENESKTDWRVDEKGDFNFKGRTGLKSFRNERKDKPPLDDTHDLHHSRNGKPSSDNDDIQKESSTGNAKKQRRATLAGSHLKPLSIQLTKLDWLVDSKRQSFSVKEILQKEDGESPGQGRKVGPKNGGRQRRKYKGVIRQEQASSKVLTEFRKLLAGNDGGIIASCLKGEPGEKLVPGLFGGVMGHRTQCCECEMTSDRPENFLDISIPVRAPTSSQHRHSDDEEEEGEKNTRNNVFQLLKSFSSRERMCKENKYFCDRCFHLVEAERFCYFQQLPKILAIHLKRFDAGLGCNMGRVSKISDHVSVPLSLPCLMMKCSNAAQQPCLHHRYSLYGVVTHSGSSILRGHYRSYVKVSSSFNSQILCDSSDTDHDDDRTPSPVPFTTFSSSSYLSLSSSSSSSNQGNPSTAKQQQLSNGLVEGNASFHYSDSAKTQSSSLATHDASERTSGTSASLSLQCPALEEGTRRRRGEKSWWLECDDEFIRVFEEDEFLDKLTGEEESLLGTPYVLFYSQQIF